MASNRSTLCSTTPSLDSILTKMVVYPKNIKRLWHEIWIDRVDFMYYLWVFLFWKKNIRPVSYSLVRKGSKRISSKAKSKIHYWIMIQQRLLFNTLFQGFWIYAIYFCQIMKFHIPKSFDLKSSLQTLLHWGWYPWI